MARSTPQAGGANQRWSMDFAADSLYTGRRFRALAVVDDYSRECPAIEVDSSPGKLSPEEFMANAGKTLIHSGL